MEIYLRYGDKMLRLPVVPESFTVNTKQNNEVISISDFGEINLKGNKGLCSLSFSSEFPSSKRNYYRGKFKEPYVFVNKIKAHKDKKHVIRLIMTDTNVNLDVLIDSFDYSEKDGSGDVYYTLNLSEYITPSVYEYVKSGKKLLKRRIKEAPKTVTVKSGDTLKKISKRVYGTSSKFTLIASKNGIKAPYKITPGTVLII